MEGTSRTRGDSGTATPRTHAAECAGVHIRVNSQIRLEHVDPHGSQSPHGGPHLSFPALASGPLPSLRALALRLSVYDAPRVRLSPSDPLSASGLPPSVLLFRHAPHVPGPAPPLPRVALFRPHAPRSRRSRVGLDVAPGDRHGPGAAPLVPGRAAALALRLDARPARRRARGPWRTSPHAQRHRDVAATRDAAPWAHAVALGRARRPATLNRVRGQREARRVG